MGCPKSGAPGSIPNAFGECSLFFLPRSFSLDRYITHHRHAICPQPLLGPPRWHLGPLGQDGAWLSSGKLSKKRCYPYEPPASPPHAAPCDPNTLILAFL